MAANGHSHPATLSHTGPRNTWSDGTSSQVWHYPATQRIRLILKQVCRAVSQARGADPCWAWHDIGRDRSDGAASGPVTVGGVHQQRLNRCCFRSVER